MKTLTTMIAFTSSRVASPGFTPFCPGDSSANEPLVVPIVTGPAMIPLPSSRPASTLDGPAAGCGALSVKNKKVATANRSAAAIGVSIG
jgi:hypothetical protein